MKANGNWSKRVCSKDHLYVIFDFRGGMHKYYLAVLDADADEAGDGWVDGGGGFGAANLIASAA